MSQYLYYSMIVSSYAPSESHDKLRIVNTTMTVGGRAMSAKSEVSQFSKSSTLQ